MEEYLKIEDEGHYSCLNVKPKPGKESLLLDKEKVINDVSITREERETYMHVDNPDNKHFYKDSRHQMGD